MEGLILFILFGLIASFLSNQSKRQEQTAQQPKTRPKIEVKTLDEFAKEILQQLTKEKEEQPKKPVAATNADIETEGPTIQKQKDTKGAEPINKETPKPQPAALKQNLSHPRKTQKLPFLTSKEALVNAIIAQEILGPPKSKKR